MTEIADLPIAGEMVGLGAAQPWRFNGDTCYWSKEDYDGTGGTAFLTALSYTVDGQYPLDHAWMFPEISGTTRTGDWYTKCGWLPLGFQTWTGGSSTYRAHQWGRETLPNSNAQPFDMNVNINGEHFVIPDLWINLDSNGGLAINSNWKDYALYYPQSKGSSISLYGYKVKDRELQPHILRWTTAANPGSAGGVYTVMSVEDRIYRDATVPGDFVGEFNWLLARWRMNYAIVNATGVTKDSGWRGGSSAFVSQFVSLPTGYKLDGDGTLEHHDDILCELGTENIAGTVRDLFVMNIDTQDTVPIYVQRFSLQNESDVTQVMRSNDYSWQHTDTVATAYTDTTARAWKVTVKWSGTIKLFVADAKLEIGGEYGETYTNSNTTTYTHTDTRTFTMPGQLLTVQPKTAFHVDIVMMKGNVVGTLGQVVDITDLPQFQVAIARYAAPGTFSASTVPVKPTYKVGKIDIRKAAELLNMQSIKTTYQPETPGAPAMSGAFIIPALSFASSHAAQGSVRFTDAEYAPIPDSEAPRMPIVIPPGGKEEKK